MGLFSTTVNDIRKWEQEKEVDKIAKALQDKKPEVIKTAIIAFGNLRISNGAPLLIPFLNDKDSSIRTLTEQAIIKIGYVTKPDLIRAKTQIILNIREAVVNNAGKYIINYSDEEIRKHYSDILHVIKKYDKYFDQDKEPPSPFLFGDLYEYQKLEKLFDGSSTKVDQLRKVISLVNNNYHDICRSVDSLIERFELLYDEQKVDKIDTSLLNDFIKTNELNSLLIIYNKVSDEGQRAQLFEAICNNYNPKLKEFVLSSFLDKNPNIRALVVKTIDKIADCNIVEILTLAFNDKDNKVRTVAENALKNINNIDTLVRLYEKENNTNQESRSIIFNKLCTNYNPQLSHYILNALTDVNDKIRADAVRTLIKINNIDIVELLTASLNDKDQNVTSEAQTVLKNINDLDTLIRFHENKNNANQNARFIIFEKICTMFNLQLSQYILDALNDVNDKIRALAVKMLEKAKCDNKFDLFLNALKDNESNVRIEAVAALEKFMDKRALPYLLDAVDNNGPCSVLNLKILYLSIMMGHTPDISGLINDLNDKSYDIRKTAASALIKIANLNFSLVRSQWNTLIPIIEKPNINYTKGSSSYSSNDCGGHSDSRQHTDVSGIGITIPAELKRNK